MKELLLLLLLSHEYFLILLSLGVFFLTLFLLPRIRENSLKLGFTDTPNSRSSHSDIVPTFGGVAFYAAFIFMLFLTQRFDENNLTITLIASLTVMFFIGLKDDLQNLSAKKKFIGQLIAVFILMFHSGFRIYSFHGFLGIEDIPLILSLPLSSFLLLGLLNAYNLIDGIDGLASIVGIVIASSFGFLFYKLELWYYLAICITTISMLFAFLRFNFSTKKKIFMGDTGSLLIGLVLGLLTMKLLSLGSGTFSEIAISRQEIPLLILCILIIPTFDISRVMFIRLNRKKSIFSADRNHIHHILIDSGLSHKKASLLVGLINLCIIGVMYFSIKNYGVFFSMFLLFVLILFLIFFFFIMNKTYTTKKTKVKIRNLLFKYFSFFTTNNKSISKNIQKNNFKQKLKSFGIFFY